MEADACSAVKDLQPILPTERKRVLVIGIDAVTLDLLAPWVEAGKLPNIAKLMAQGSYGKLASTIQPISAPAWASFMTGMNPGKHGLYDFVRRQREGYGIEVTNGSMISAPTLFQRVSDAGYRVIAINVPYTYPPKPVNGIVVSGPFIAVSDASIIYPKEKAEAILNLVGDYRILPDYDATKQQPLTTYGEALLQGVEMRHRIAKNLIKNEPWDLFTVVFMATDPVQHYFWHCMTNDGETEDCPRDMILQVYQRVDTAIGDLLTEIDEHTVVMLLSDHGAGPLIKMVNLNRWLADRNWVSFKAAGGKKQRRWQSQIVSNAMRLYRKYVSSHNRARIRGWLGVERFDQLKGGVESALFSSAIDWNNTRAYAIGAGGNIFLNVKGREPAGTIEPGEEFEKVLQAVATEFMELRDPDTGERMLRKVWRGTELYNGPYQNLAPDLVLEWVNYGYWGRGRYDVQNVLVFENAFTTDFSDLLLSGTHRRQGVLILSGHGVIPGLELQNASIVDLAPTILAYLSIPVPEDMDGHVLRDNFTNDAVTIHYSSGDAQKGSEHEFSKDETDTISNRLRQLGYL